MLLLLAAAWLFWSGIYKPLLLWLGAFSCALSVYIAHRVGFFEQATGLHVIPKLPISPTVVYLEAEPEGPVGQVILANSITLTPGTVTLDVFNDRLCVHCLTSEGAQALESGDANRRVARLTSK